MSIANEITRIQNAKNDIKAAIEGKGVTVPSTTKIDGYADLVDDIQTGGGGGVTVESLSVTENGTYTAPSGKAYTPVSVNVPAPVVLVNISATYTPSGTVYDVDSLDDLKNDLVVTALYSDSSTETVPSNNYVLSGTLEAGTQTITVTVDSFIYGDASTTFQVNVVGVVYLFKDGDECTTLTGGYEKKGFQNNTSRLTYGNTGTCLSIEQTTAGTGTNAGTLASVNAVDLSNYKSIHFDFESYRTKTDGSYFRGYICETVTNGTTYNAAFGDPKAYKNLYIVTTQPTGRTTVDLELTDEYTATSKHIAVNFNSINSAPMGAYVKVYNIYLKPKDNISDAEALNILLGGDSE